MKTYLKANGTLYPASFRGRTVDSDWDGRDTIAVTLDMTYAQATELFVDDLEWSLVQTFDPSDSEGNEPVLPETVERDYSEYCLAGSITDHRNGAVTAKMGKIKAEEALAELMEVLA